MAEQTESWVNRALRDIPAKVQGWGSTALDTLRSGVNSAGTALDNAWNSPPPAPANTGTTPPPAVPDDPALRATDPEVRPARSRLRTIAQPDNPPVTVNPEGDAFKSGTITPVQNEVPPEIGPEYKAAAAEQAAANGNVGRGNNFGPQAPEVTPGGPTPATPDTLAAQNRAARVAQYGEDAVAKMEAAGSKWGGGIPPSGGGGAVPPNGGALPPETPSWWDSAKGRMAAQAGVQSNGLKTAAKVGMSGLEGVGSVAKALGRRAPGVAQAYEVADSASKAFSPEGAAEPMWKHGLRLGARMAGIGGGAALGAIPGAALGPAGVIGGGVAGGALGYEAMNGLTDWALGPEPGQGIADRIKAAGMRAQAQPTAPTPADVESGSVGKPDANSGASNKFTRTGDPDVDYRNANAYLMAHGARPEQLADSGLRGGAQPAQAEDDTAPFRKVAEKGGVHAMFALGGYGALSRIKSNEMNAGLRSQQIQATSDLARSQMVLGQYNKDREYNTGREDNNAKVNDQALEDYTKSSIPGQNTNLITGEKPADYANRVAQEKSKLADQINYTLGDTSGKRIGQLDGTHLQQLLMGAKFKAKLEAGRGDLLNRMHDFTGNKQFDSRNLYSYMPSGAQPTMLPNSGGYRIQMKNGNTMTVYNARGGGFNLTSPNDPVDADAEQYIAPFIKQLRAQGK